MLKGPVLVLRQTGRHGRALAAFAAGRALTKWVRRSISEKNASGIRLRVVLLTATTTSPRCSSSKHAPSTQCRPLRDPYTLYAHLVAFDSGWFVVDGTH